MIPPHPRPVSTRPGERGESRSIADFQRVLVATTLFAVACLALISGCQKSTGEPARSDAATTKTEAVVRVVSPERRTISHPIEQPGFNIESFQETPLHAKISGFVRKWNVDIGDHVKRNQVLAELDVPEMVAELRQKEAAIQQALAQVQQAKATLLSAEAQRTRAKSQFERLAKAGKGGVIGKEDVEETRLNYAAAGAGVERAKADVAAAEAQVKAATASRDYAQTMLQYATIRAPYDGVVTQRNINEGDFIVPAAAGAKGQPLYVVNQTDPVRVFVNVPGADAAWIKDGDPVVLRLQGAGGEVFQGTITRNTRALDPQSRTLRTEIDVPNPAGKLLPGMYMQARIVVQRTNVWTLPAAAVATEGDQTICVCVIDGKAVRTPLQIGLSGGGFVQVVKKQVKSPSPGEEGRWEDVTGDEKIVAADPAALSDGQQVRVESEKK